MSNLASNESPTIDSFTIESQCKPLFDIRKKRSDIEKAKAMLQEERTLALARLGHKRHPTKVLPSLKPVRDVDVRFELDLAYPISDHDDESDDDHYSGYEPETPCRQSSDDIGDVELNWAITESLRQLSLQAEGATKAELTEELPGIVNEEEDEWSVLDEHRDNSYDAKDGDDLSTLSGWQSCVIRDDDASSQWTMATDSDNYEASFRNALLCFGSDVNDCSSSTPSKFGPPRMREMRHQQPKNGTLPPIDEDFDFEGNYDTLKYGVHKEKGLAVRAWRGKRTRRSKRVRDRYWA